ncbi:hypothetical protein SODALDRAFT_331329 [Sodiomyces alkalinus F11]|uniref:DUF7707 domain-containing protein n=1 Tax=Sodiomyces alkalinus (strain CBS 110278 / VKM F-3762 / F11) TaxID=1314773 RepID=A0A3N2Q489_SODAK|nr:hypothetical protein SODALDRAFT_331329 [Sodiomyces alkalinus F11]ROT41580.1 hypothetical protein SODALDRAFT_331329 [Sodiomyces alkalinus F11]
MPTLATVALALVAASSLVSAQRKVYTNEDLASVDAIDIGTRNAWCQGQRNVCTRLCDNAVTNDCSTSTLDYDCQCSNGTAPGLEYYRSSMPSFICNAVFEECIIANVGNARGQQQCEDDRDAACDPDELLDAFTENTSTAAEAPAATTSPTASATSVADASQTEDPEPTAEADDDDSFAAPTAAPVVGAAALAIAVFAYLV